MKCVLFTCYETVSVSLDLLHGFNRARCQVLIAWCNKKRCLSVYTGRQDCVLLFHSRKIQKATDGLPPSRCQSARSSVTGRSVGLCHASASLTPSPYFASRPKSPLPCCCHLKQGNRPVCPSVCCACPHRSRFDRDSSGSPATPPLTVRDSS